MQQLQEINLHLNIKKCAFRVQSISFIGLQVDPEKIQAIHDMPTAPTNKTKVQRFLRMTNYLSRYISHHRDQTKVLWTLTHNDVPFIWDANDNKEFKELKEDLCSKAKIGAACLQNGQPVAFASRVLAPNEQKWAQIEKELLAIVFACTKFHDYIYGKEVIIKSDHKPLATIFKKQLERPQHDCKTCYSNYRSTNPKLCTKKKGHIHCRHSITSLQRQQASQRRTVWIWSYDCQNCNTHARTHGSRNLSRTNEPFQFGRRFWSSADALPPGCLLWID